MKVILWIEHDGHVDRAVIRAHVDWVRQHEAAGTFLWTGPFGDGGGGMILAEVPDLDAARALAATDPFLRHGVARTVVRPWSAGPPSPEYFLQVIRRRRSVRRFRPDAVPDALLLKVLDAGRWAPSPHNLQLRAFVVVREPKARQALMAAAYGQPQVGEAPVVVVACQKPVTRVFEPPDDRFDPAADVYLAVANVLLAAEAAGLGAGPVGGFEEDRVRGVCGIPGEVRVRNLIPLGWPAEEPEPQARPALEEVVFSERFGRPADG